MAQQIITITINAGITITSGAPPAGEVGVPYSHQFTATGGSGSFAWTVTAGTLPAGLSLNSSTGLLSGTPTTAGTSSNITINCASA